MEDIIDHAAALAVIFGAIGGAFSYCILTPLKDAIKNLNKAVLELRNELIVAENRRHALELLVARIEQRTQADHERLERLEGLLRE